MAEKPAGTPRPLPSDETRRKAVELDAEADRELAEAKNLAQAGKVNESVDLTLDAVSKEREAVRVQQQAISEHKEEIDLESFPTTDERE